MDLSDPSFATHDPPESLCCRHDATTARLTSPILWRLSFPVLVVDPLHRLLYRNLAGQALLDAGQVFLERDGRLACVSSGDRAHLERALRACFSQPVGDHRAAVRRSASFCLTQRAYHHALTATVARLDAGAITGFAPGAPAARVILSRGLSLSPMLKTVLRDLFELTESEAAIAEALWDGLTIAEIARARQTSATTVRTQIRSVFAKTLVTRQQDLIRLLASLPQLAIADGAVPTD